MAGKSGIALGRRLAGGLGGLLLGIGGAWLAALAGPMGRYLNQPLPAWPETSALDVGIEVGIYLPGLAAGLLAALLGPALWRGWGLVALGLLLLAEIARAAGKLFFGPLAMTHGTTVTPWETVVLSATPAAMAAALLAALALMVWLALLRDAGVRPA